MPTAPGKRNGTTKRRDYRPDSTQRGYTSKWEKAARRFRLQHPLCVHCLRVGVTTPAECVDHIEPHKGNQHLFWDATNWQSLCKYCHNTKTWLERYAVTWLPREGLTVISGKPGVGKTQYATNNFGEVFDLDDVAHAHGFGSYPRPDEQHMQLLRIREKHFSQYDSSGTVEPDTALIVCHPIEAHGIARRLRAKWLHLTCDPKQLAFRVHCR